MGFQTEGLEDRILELEKENGELFKALQTANHLISTKHEALDHSMGEIKCQYEELIVRRRDVRKLKEAESLLHEDIKKLVEENKKMKRAIRDELKRCDGTVSILSKCLRELNEK